MDSLDWTYIKASLQKGNSYGSIAVGLNVNKNTLIAYCRTKGLTKRKLASSHLRASLELAVKEVRAHIVFITSM